MPGLRKLTVGLAVLTTLTFGPRPAAAVIPLDCTAAPAGAPDFRVELLYPDPAASVACRAEIAGEAALASQPGFDVYVIIDSSGSTAGASGLDLDGDGLVGEGDWRTNTDPDDSTLRAELEAVRRAVAVWEARDVRVALLEYSAFLPIPPGEPEEQGRIRTVQGLTSDLNLVRAGLDDILAQGSVGATDYGGALFELAAEFDRSGDPARRPVAFFLSDGKPTFPRYPYDTTEPLDVVHARDGAAEVALRGLPVHTLEVGSFDDIGVLQEVADITGGTLLPELEGEGLLDALLTVSLDGFDDATLANGTSGVVVHAQLNAFGSFQARIELEDGPNPLLFLAMLRTPDGEWAIECPLFLEAECAGCTYTQGYWKNHHRYSPRSNQLIPWPIDEDTELCGQTWLENLQTPVAGNVLYVLSHQWIAASLNQATGASVPDEVAEALAMGEALMADCVIDDDERALATAFAETLDLFNNGEIGPGHCDDGGSAEPPVIAGTERRDAPGEIEDRRPARDPSDRALRVRRSLRR